MAESNLPKATPSWIDVTPLKLWRHPHSRKTLRAVVRTLLRPSDPMASLAADGARGVGIEMSRKAGRHAVPLRFCTHVLCDLRAQGWALRLTSKGIFAGAPLNNVEALAEKARVKLAHLVERDAQLQQSSVRRFIEGLERPRLHKGEWRSIFSLMRDGRELAAALSSVKRNATPEGRDDALRIVIDPYLQIAQSGRLCAFTGLDLQDVWRYFRHTWTTTYQSTPGRKLFFLVRDRAAPNHPVIGIAALGSPIVQLSVRDQWIGWTLEQVLAAMREGSRTAWLRWLDGSLEALLRGIYTKDFVRSGHVTKAAIRTPTGEIVETLRQLALDERSVHRLYPERGQHKSAGRKASAGWSGQAETHLFRSKRAGALAELLNARLQLQAVRRANGKRSEWLRDLESDSLRRSIGTILRYTKAAHVGVEMMDINVCGAVAPYNHLLGGKLVSLLMASPEVRAEYSRRYRSASSIIASSMAGRSVVRAPRLVLLGTTSLYGVAPSQYNRLKMPADAVGGPDGTAVNYECLGQTAGYGSYHFSRDTLAALEPLLGRLQRGRPVNSIFGEGVNPKLRKVRAALDAVGLPSNLLLQHGSPRLVYGIALAKNFREVLLGLQSRPAYLVPARPDASKQIIEFWLKRWLTRRIENEAVIKAVSMHALTVPIQHGARVTTPTAFEALQPGGNESVYSDLQFQIDEAGSSSSGDEEAVDSIARRVAVS